MRGRIDYKAADVTNRDHVARVVQQIKHEHGRVDLLVHGAGVQTSTRLEHRSLDDFRKTFSVKVAGLRNLIEACREQFGETVRTHVLTSAYSIFGNDGQHDYGAANETLDRLCGLTQGWSQARWSSIAWLAWDGVGMTRGSEYQALAKNRGLSGVTAEVGQQVFREVMSGRSGAVINVPMSDAEHARYEIKTVPPRPCPSTSRVLERTVELSKIDCLSHHKVRSTPTLPGAWILERMVSGALELRKDAPGLSWAIVHNATFNRFVRSADGQEPNLRIIAEEVDGAIMAWLIGDIRHSSGAVLSKDLVFAQARIEFSSDASELRSSLRNLDLRGADSDLRLVTDPYCDRRRNDVVELSGPFDCVRDIAIGSEGRKARFTPQTTHRSSEVIPAYLLDSAWRVGAMYAEPNKDELYVPVQIGRLVLPIRPGSEPGLERELEIRATAPRFENGRVRWDRTEAYNEVGGLQILVEDALASPLT